MRDILHELDDKISPSDLDLMIDEIDADGSGTVDFEGMRQMIIQNLSILFGWVSGKCIIDLSIFEE